MHALNSFFENLVNWTFGILIIIAIILAIVEIYDRVKESMSQEGEE